VFIAVALPGALECEDEEEFLLMSQQPLPRSQRERLLDQVRIAAIPVRHRTHRRVRTSRLRRHEARSSPCDRLRHDGIGQ
jgi:hypothetical protein